MDTYQVARADTDRFNRFLWHENERLNRLIRNLYLEFQLKHYTERELYDRICQEVADYFHAAGCQLYLVCYEELRENRISSQGYPIADVRLRKWLELAGATGPWRRAMRQQYVRTRSRSRYELSFREDYVAGKGSSSTRRDFLAKAARRYPCTYALPGQHHQSERKPEPDELQEDVPHQVVWRNDGLYNTCRCVLAAPLIRDAVPPESGASAMQRGKTRKEGQYRIGLIKVENRVPYGVRGFSEIPLQGDLSGDLLFEKEWEVAALRPYVRDLQQRCCGQDFNVFEPLVNDVGWQQYFEDNPLGRNAYEGLLHALRELRKQHATPAARREVRQKYSQLAQWLWNLVESLVRVEAYLQQLRHACQVLCGLSEPTMVDRPHPSFFNVFGFRAAYLTELAQAPLEVLECITLQSEKEGGRLYGRALNALLECLSISSPEDRDLLRQEAFLVLGAEAMVRLFEHPGTWDKALPEHYKLFHKSFVTVLKHISQSKDAARPRYTQDAEALRDLLGDHESASNPGAADREALAASATAFRESVQRDLKDRIDKCLMDRVQALRKVLGSDDRAFDARQSLNDPLPDWDFAGAVRTIVEDLREISRRISGNRASPDDGQRPAKQYELLAEEEEMQRIGRQVRKAVSKEPESGNATGQRQLEELVIWVANAVAVGTMFAESFQKVDEDRLMFIASHVAQILDNHLLFQARQRDLDLDHASLDTFGLDAPGIKLLDRLQFLVKRILRTLEFLARRAASYSEAKDSEAKDREAKDREAKDREAKDHSPNLTKEFTCVGQVLLNSFRDALRAAIEGRSEDHGSPFAGDCRGSACRNDLTVLHLSVKPALILESSLLGQILRCGRDQGVSVCEGGEGGTEHCRCLLFRPNDRLSVPPRRAATCRLCVWTDSAQSRIDNPKKAQGEVVELRLYVPDESLNSRDLRGLWSAVKVLEDILEVLEVVARG